MSSKERLAIRLAGPGDLAALMRIFDSARSFMRRSGNMHQWDGGYPSESLMRSEIAAGHCLVCGTQDGEAVGTFCFIMGEDPTYRIIEQGAWLHPGPYGTIHRLASSGKTGGVAAACFDWCWERIHNLRADTHADNAVMRRLLEGAGFVRCGIIYTDDGSPRIAYQKYAVGQPAAGREASL